MTSNNFNYTNIESLLDRVKPRHTLILTGDFNSEIGTRHADTDTVLGPHGPTHRNARGQQLLNFCQEHNLAVANTWTAQRNKSTRWQPRWGSGHLLDYFLVPHAHIGHVHKVLTLHPDIACMGRPSHRLDTLHRS